MDKVHPDRVATTSRRDPEGARNRLLPDAPRDWGGGASTVLGHEAVEEKLLNGAAREGATAGHSKN